MQPVHIVGVVAKSQDAVQIQQATPRTHALTQDLMAARAAHLADMAAEKVGTVPPEDRLELSAEGEGSGAGYGAGDTGSAGSGEDDAPDGENPSLDSPDGPEHRIDFMA